MKAPIAKKIPKNLTIHNHTRTDNYFWLNKREDQKVIDYLNSENAYTKEVMHDTEKIQEQLFKEFTSRIKPSDESVPYFLNGYFYYTRFNKGDEQPIICRKKHTLDEKEEIMLDANDMAKGHDYFDLDNVVVSEDNSMAAYSFDTVSRRKYTICIKNLITKETLSDKIPNTSGSIIWANDNKTIFYTTKDETLRQNKIFKHLIGTSVKDDVLIYEEKDSTFDVDVTKSKSRKYIFIVSSSSVSDEYRYIDANNITKEIKIIQPRERDLEYSVSHFGNYFYILTNAEAKNFKIVRTSTSNTTKEYWEDIIPHRNDVLIEDITLFKSFYAIQERINGLTQIRIKSWDNSIDYHIPFSESTFAVHFANNPEFNVQEFRYIYTSLTTPKTTVEINYSTQKKTVLKQTPVIGTYSPNDYLSERIYATANDNTQIPISLVYKKGVKRDGTAPILLYAYGSYGYSIDPYFSFARISLLDRGFIFAIAHIRGGEEMGRYWYDEGKMLNKRNTFTDFIACTKHIIEKKYAHPDKVFAMGGSAGGLLMGAIANMQPQLYKGIIAAVPFVDVITTMLDESIPLTTGEYDEWGNPNIKKYYDYILSYSPYDNVKQQNYPAMLVTTGLHDSQVQYWEPAKWVAKLRDIKTDNNPLLLWTNMNFGHSGASGRFEPYKETALEYAFILKILG